MHFIHFYILFMFFFYFFLNNMHFPMLPKTGFILVYFFANIDLFFCCGLCSALTDTTWVANELLDLSFSLEEDR